MRTLPFAVMAALALVLQVSLMPALRVKSGEIFPQLPLILAMYVALYARAEAALLGCWTLGLLMDLGSTGPVGGFAFAFGLAALGIVALRASLFRDHALSHVFLAFVFGFLANGLVTLIEATLAALRSHPHDFSGFAAQHLLVQPFGIAVYTALIAPYVMLLLNRFRRSMHFPDRV